MPDILSSADGTLNGALTDTWTMTLGASNTLKFVNFEAGQRFTVKLVQDSSGSRTVSFPSTVTWQAGQAPTLKTAANAVDIFTFINDGTLGSPTFRDLGSSGYRLPPAVRDAGLTTMIAAGVTGLTLLLSNGGGAAHTGNLPAGVLIKAGSGSTTQTLAAIDGSGSYVIGSTGSLAVGLTTPGTSRYDTGKFFVRPTGALQTKSTISGSTVTVNNPVAGALHTACYNTGGTLSYCQIATGANGTCACK